MDVLRGGEKGDVPSLCNSMALISAPKAKRCGRVPICAALSDGRAVGALRVYSFSGLCAPANANAARVRESRRNVYMDLC